MRHELHLIPPAPRRPRWPPVLWARWPLALLAFLASVYGGVVTLMFFYAWGGKANDDVRLDRGAVRAIGEVTGVTPVRVTLDGRPSVRIDYRFTPAGEPPLGGQSLIASDGQEPGTSVDVQYLAAEPHVNRLAGARINHVRDFAAPLWRWLVLPGVISFAVWFGWVLLTRRTLVHGDVALAELDEVTELRYVIPRMLRVRYGFRDHHAVRRHGWHWVRARSALGMKLLQKPTPRVAPVVHSRNRPWDSRLASAEDFVPAEPARPLGLGADVPRWLDHT